MSSLTFKIVFGGGEFMGTAERRNEILRILCRKRHETIENLASELAVPINSPPPKTILKVKLDI